MIRNSSASTTRSGQNSSRAVPAATPLSGMSAPSEVRRAPSPGAMFDSSAENRSTAKRSGSSSVPAAAAPGVALGLGVGDAVGVALGEPDGVGAAITSARYTPSCRVVTNVTDDAPVAPGASCSTVPSGSVTRTPCASGGMGISIGADGGSGSRTCCGPTPSSSPATFEIMIGHATWSGRSLWRISKANTTVGRLSRKPA